MDIRENYAKLHGHIAAAVQRTLTGYELKFKGGWQAQKPDRIAEDIAVYAMAAIGPVIDQEVSRVVVATLRLLLADDAWLASEGLKRAS